MKKNKGRHTRDQQLSLRINARTKFQLDYLVRVTHLSLTRIVENAIKDAADRKQFTQLDIDGIPMAIGWKELWHPDEAVSAIRFLTNDAFEKFHSIEDQQALMFITFHWMYFFTDRSMALLERENINTIWPHMPELVEVWMDCKAKDPRCVKDRLETILSDAGLAPCSIDDITSQKIAS